MNFTGLFLQYRQMASHQLENQEKQFYHEFGGLMGGTQYDMVKVLSSLLYSTKPKIHFGTTELNPVPRMTPEKS